MDSPVKSAPGAKWTHLAQSTWGKIDTPETIDLLGHGNTPGTIDYCKLDTLSTIRPGAKLVQLRQLTSWEQNGSHSALYCNYSQYTNFYQPQKINPVKPNPFIHLEANTCPHSPLLTSGTILVFFF